MSVPKLRFDDAWKRPAPRFCSGWGVAFDLKRPRRHAGPARTGGPGAAAPAAATAGSLPAAENPYICSGKSLVSGLSAVPLPHFRDALTWWCGRPAGAPRPLTRFWPEMASMPAWKSECLPEMRAGCQKMFTSRTLRGRYSLNLQLGAYSARIRTNPRSGAGSVACDENREMLRGT